jgi:hypothetical protein
MSLYAPEKPTPVAKSFVEAVRASCSAWLQSSSFVAIVGARPLLADSHVWRPVIEAAGEIWYIGSEDAAVSLAGETGSRFKHVGDTFAAGFPVLERRLKILA